MAEQAPEGIDLLAGVAVDGEGHGSGTAGGGSRTFVRISGGVVFVVKHWEIRAVLEVNC